MEGSYLLCVLCILLWIRALDPCADSLEILCVGSIKIDKGQAAKNDYNIKNTAALILTKLSYTTLGTLETA